MLIKEKTCITLQIISSFFIHSFFIVNDSEGEYRAPNVILPRVHTTPPQVVNKTYSRDYTNIFPKDKSFVQQLFESDDDIPPIQPATMANNTPVIFPPSQHSAFRPTKVISTRTIC